ncbi:MAG: hypothetical protein ACLSVD_08980 [Eggerthellaceae bacterium]
MLGYRNGKIVCACKDFTFPGKRLFEFKDIKNALSDDDGGFDSAPSDGESVFLGDVLATIETSDLLRSVPGVLERFWDMFVVDAFIKNPDRNNGNWGVLMDASFSYELAPVYDLGSSLFSKRGDSLARRRMLDESDSIGCVRDERVMLSPAFGRWEERPFTPPTWRKCQSRSRCGDQGFMGSVDMDRIDALIDSVPAEAYDGPRVEAVRASHASASSKDRRRLRLCSRASWSARASRRSLRARGGCVPGFARGLRRRIPTLARRAASASAAALSNRKDRHYLLTCSPMQPCSTALRAWSRSQRPSVNEASSRVGRRPPPWGRSTLARSTCRSVSGSRPGEPARAPVAGKPTSAGRRRRLIDKVVGNPLGRYRATLKAHVRQRLASVPPCAWAILVR